MATHRGKVHDYLGMIFDFTVRGKVMVTMMEYIKTIIKDFPEGITGTNVSPTVDHLFMVRDLSLAKVLPEEQATAFHCAKAQLLFQSARFAAINLACHGFSDHTSAVTRQGRLGQGQEDAGLPEGHPAHAPDSVGGLTDALAMVGGPGVQHAQQLPRTYGGGDELWPRNGP